MRTLRRVDLEGKVIVHGRRYIYNTGHPYHPRMSGIILWDREALDYLFHPDDKELQPILVPFELFVRSDGRREMETSDFWREPKKKVSNGNGVVQTESQL